MSDISDDLYDAYAAVTPDSMITRRMPSAASMKSLNIGKARGAISRGAMTPATFMVASSLPWTYEYALPKAAMYTTGVLNMLGGVSDIGTVAEGLYNGYKTIADAMYDYKNDKEYQSGNYKYANNGGGGF